MTKKIDFAVLLLITVISSLITFYFRFSFVWSPIIMFVPAGIYLAYKNPRQIKKVSIFSLVFSVPFTFFLDYLISKDNGWYIISSVFPYRLFNIVAIEQFIWGFTFCFYVIAFYEYFLDKKTKKVQSFGKRMRWFSFTLFALLGIFVYLAMNYSQLLFLPYAYGLIGIFLGIIPLAIFLIKHPKLIGRFLKSVAYFSIVTTLNELISLKLDYWIFPGNNFVGKIIFFGYVIPYEEIIFYLILSTPILFTYYEFFDDDSK